MIRHAPLVCEKWAGVGLKSFAALPRWAEREKERECACERGRVGEREREHFPSSLN